MKQINKIQETKSLVQHRANQPAFYHNLPLAAMDDLRANLLLEQGHICCYCMKRIPRKIEKDETVSYEMKVEHYKCQDNYPALQLNYSNLLGACTGNEGNPKKLQTCDTKKGNTDITINPTLANPNCEMQVKYLSNGEIHSDDPIIEKELTEVLNLNMQSLVDCRREVFETVQKKVEIESKKFGDRNIRKKYFEREAQWWLKLDGGKYKQYCMVAVYYLNKKIRQNQN
ncbi:MAG: retron system putative HNH endonuclease [Bacteroidota bacterium]